jgi:HlyD family secretion protein
MKQRARFLLPLLLVAVVVLVVVFRQRGPDTLDVSASGTIEATEADLGFQTAGRIVEVRVQEGDRVIPGDTLALLDRSELVAARDAAAAAVTAAEARLAELEAGPRDQEVRQARAALRAARESEAEALRERDRTQRLHDGGAVSRQALDAAVSRREVAQARREQTEESLALLEAGARVEQIAAQEAALAQAHATLSRAEAALDYTVVLAPSRGVVALRHREPGESAAPGAPVVTLRNVQDRWVRIYVREDRIGQIRIGQTATITADSHPGRTFDGEVFFIGSEAEFTPRNVQTTEERTRLVYPVKVRVTDDPDEALKPGTPADVILHEGPAA